VILQELDRSFEPVLDKIGETQAAKMSLQTRPSTENHGEMVELATHPQKDAFSRSNLHRLCHTRKKRS
jgi:hypothetical protein